MANSSTFRSRLNSFVPEEKKLKNVAKTFWGAAAVFAFIGSFFLAAIPLPVYAALILAGLGGGLAFSYLGKTPLTSTRKFLFIAGALTVLAIASAMLFALPVTPVLGIGIGFALWAGYELTKKFLQKPHSLTSNQNLPFLAKTAYVLSGAAFLGLTAGFALIAAHILPAHIILPIFLSLAVVTSILSSCATKITSSSVKASLPVGVSTAGFPASTAVAPNLNAGPAVAPSNATPVYLSPASGAVPPPITKPLARSTGTAPAKEGGSPHKEGTEQQGFYTPYSPAFLKSGSGAENEGLLQLQREQAKVGDEQASAASATFVKGAQAPV